MCTKKLEATLVNASYPHPASPVPTFEFLRYFLQTLNQNHVFLLETTNIFEKIEFTIYTPFFTSNIMIDKRKLAHSVTYQALSLVCPRNSLSVYFRLIDSV